MPTGTNDAFDQEVLGSQQYLRRFGQSRWGHVIPPHDLADVIQETLLGGIKGRADFRGEATVQSWLTQIFKNKAIAYYRSRQRQPVFVEDLRGSNYTGEISLPPEPATEIDQEGVVLVEESAARVREAVAGLSPDHREIIRLFYYEDMPVKLIAEQLNIAVNTVKTRLHYAKKYLAEQLADLAA